MPLPLLNFRVRLTLRWTVVFSALLAAGSIWIYVGIRATILRSLDRQLRTLAATEVTSAVDRPSSAPHLHELPVPTLAGGTFTTKVVQLFDTTGRPLQALPVERASLPLSDPDHLKLALAGEAPIATVVVQGQAYRTVTVRLAAEGQWYAMVVAVGMEDVAGSLADIRWLLVIVWMVSTAATGAAGFALASNALVPVRTMTRRALEIARGDIRERLDPPHGRDEISEMTQALNALIDRLHIALEANRRFAADAAHELRSPVTAIAGEIDVALRRDRTADEYRNTLTIVQSRLSVLTTLIAELMLLVRAQESRTQVRLREVRVDEVVRASIDRLRSAAAARQVRVAVSTVTPCVTYADPGLLGRVFDNVIENAIRYNRDGGSVEITGAFAESEPDEWAAGTLSLRIADTGTGIPAPDRERVFDRFYRVDQSRNRVTGGFGLGLAIAREVLALFRGQVFVESSSEAGTTLRIDLPARSDLPAQAAAAPIPS
ncbi:MAG: HAMP domain-containing protein [Acidobacteria bacterium]|nr:HAMP domain-containing protein [Acidobacteriota bacterium]